MRRDSILSRALPIYVALLFAILTVVALALLARLGHVLLVLFATALAGPAGRLERLRVPRGVAVVLIYLAALAVVVAVAWVVVPPVFGQVASLADRAPQYAERYRGLRETYERLREDYPALGPFDRQVARVAERLVSGAGERVTAMPGLVFELFLDALAVLVISLLLITNRERLLGFGLSLVHPTDRELVGALLAKMGRRVGAYLRAKVIVMAIVGVLMYLALLVIGVPFAILLAVIVAFGEAIPRVGPWLARIPLLGIAALDGWKTFLLTLVASVLVENAKGYVISPFVEGEQLDIHPLLVFVAVLVGGALAGFAGAFVAVPAAAIVQTLVEDVVVPWRRSQFERRGEAVP